MYLYYYSTIDCSIPFVWFRAEGRSIYEVATMYQQGLIKREFIKEEKLGHTRVLVVGFTNFDEYKFISGMSYHLYITKTDTPGYTKVLIPFDEGSYVADIYRIPIDNISENIWCELFPNYYKNNNYQPPKKFTDEEEYADYISVYSSDFIDNNCSNNELINDSTKTNCIIDNKDEYDENYLCYTDAQAEYTDDQEYDDVIVLIK